MVRETARQILAPVALLAFGVGAYALVLLGVIPFGKEATAVLTVIAGGTTIFATLLRARIPAMTAGTATIGFALGTAAPIGVLGLNGVAITIGSLLVIIGGLGFVGSTLRLVGTNLQQAHPA